MFGLKGKNSLNGNATAQIERSSGPFLRGIVDNDLSFSQKRKVIEAAKKPHFANRFLTSLATRQVNGVEWLCRILRIHKIMPKNPEKAIQFAKASSKIDIHLERVNMATSIIWTAGTIATTIGGRFGWEFWSVQGIGALNYTLAVAGNLHDIVRNIVVGAAATKVGGEAGRHYRHFVKLTMRELGLGVVQIVAVPFPFVKMLTGWQEVKIEKMKIRELNRISASIKNENNPDYKAAKKTAIEGVMGSIMEFRRINGDLIVRKKTAIVKYEKKEILKVEPMEEGISVGSE
jgi:predicted RNA-binding protein with RPS1 domain